MPPSNTNVQTTGQRVVVAGATNGIGLGVALQFARTGAEVWIIGRNPQTGSEVLEKLRKASPATAEAQHRFLLADLSRISENRRVAREVSEAAGEQGVDYLILTQGGPPNPANAAANADGLDTHFAVQLMSRFILAHDLTLVHPTIKRAVAAVAVVGAGSATFDATDITLEALKKNGGYPIFAASARDCTVIDSLWQELAEKSPSVRFLHLAPGVVKTPALTNPTLPWTSKLMFGAASMLMGQSVEDYAHVPFYLIANPKGQEEVGTEAIATQWNEKPKRVAPSPASLNVETRKAIWRFMVSKLT